jgi:hypothetical protein
MHKKERRPLRQLEKIVMIFETLHTNTLLQFLATVDKQQYFPPTF